MKKESIIIAAALLSFVACRPDPEPQRDPSQVDPQQPALEGVYNPGQKIATVTYGLDGEAGEVDETWNWEGDLLSSISHGDDNSVSRFEYNAKSQLTHMKGEMEGMNVDLEYHYTADRVTSVSMKSNEGNLLDGPVVRESNGHASSIKLTLDGEMAQQMSEIFDGLFDGFGDEDDYEGALETSISKNGSKFSLDESTMECNLSWSGDNVSTLVNVVNVSFSITLDELKENDFFESMLGNYAQMLDMLPGNTPVPISFRMADSTEYTYDDHPNPYRGLWQDFSVEGFSANNVLTAHKMESASISVSLAGFPLPSIPIPGGDEEYEEYSYQYNAAGFPTVVKLDGESYRIINYKQ